MLLPLFAVGFATALPSTMRHTSTNRLEVPARAQTADATAAARKMLGPVHRKDAEENTGVRRAAPHLGSDGIAFQGWDIITCTTTMTCMLGRADFATNYTSIDKEGVQEWNTEFRFASEDNLIAFENGPFAPKYGGFDALSIATNSSEWSKNKLGQCKCTPGHPPTFPGGWHPPECARGRLQRTQSLFSSFNLC